MRRYYLRIDNEVIPCVIKLDITKTWRNEVKQTNLEGDNIIDRGNKKYKLSVVIGLVSSTVLENIERAVDEIFFKVDFYEDDSLISKMFSVNSFKKPSPVYRNGNRLNGAYYTNISLELEER